MLCARLDTAGSKLSTTATTTATAAVQCSPSRRDRSTSARRSSSSSAKYPGLGKSSPASGKSSPALGKSSSPAASPLADGGRRRRAVDRRNSPSLSVGGTKNSAVGNSPHHGTCCSLVDVNNSVGNSPHHATSSSVYGINSSVGNSPMRYGGIQSAPRSSVAVIKPAEHAGIHLVTHAEVLAGGTDTPRDRHPAIHSATHTELLAVCSEIQGDRRLAIHSDRLSPGDNNGNRNKQPQLNDPSRFTTTATTAKAAAVADEDDEGQTSQPIDDIMLSSHEEMISSLELTTSTSDGLSDKENIVRMLKHHVSSSANRLSNSVSSILY